MRIVNAYAELGLASGASESEVKAAWRRLVSQWHPDRNSSARAGAKIQRINQAFQQIRQSGFAEVSQEPQASQADDASWAASGPDQDVPGQRTECDAQSFDDAPEATDRQAGRTRTAANGDGDGAAREGSPVRTVHRKVKLTLEEAAAGCIRVMRGRITDSCSACSGMGFRVPGGACPGCLGSGAVRQRAWYGWFGASAECPQCHGDGRARQPCEVCAGSGKQSASSYQISVRIPSGVRNDDLLHVDGSRSPPGQAAVNLELRVEVAAHEFFILDDDGTVHCAMPVDGFAWVAQRSIEVPTFAGLQTMALRRDQFSYRLPGKGFPTERGGRRADLLVTVVPRFPESLSTDQQILFDQLVATFSGATGKAADPRFAAWNETLRAWERKQKKSDDPAS